MKKVIILQIMDMLIKDVSNSSLVLEDSITYLRTQGYSFENFYDLIRIGSFFAPRQFGDGSFFALS